MATPIDIVIRTQGAERAKRDLRDIGQEAGTADKLVQSFRKELFKAFTVGAAVAGLATLTNNAIKFNSAIAETSTLIDTTEFDMRRLTNSVLDQSAAFGSLPDRQAKAAYQIISAGATDASTAIDILTASNKLAVGGVTDVAVAADGLTSVLNAYGDAVGDATDVTDTLFVGIRAGKTTAEELASSLGKVAPIAANTNVEFTELVAGIAALTKGGISTREAVTGLRAILASVVKPTKEAQEAAKRLGIDFTTAGLQSKGLAGFLEDVVNKTGGSTDEIAQLFGGVEALVPVLALAGQAGEDFNDILAQMEERGGATEEAFNKIANSPGFQINRVVASLNAEFSRLINGILNAVVPAIRFLADNMNTLFDIAKIVGVFLGVTLAGQIIPIVIRAIGGLATAIAVGFRANPILSIAEAVTFMAAIFISQSDKIRLSAESQATVFDLLATLLGQLGDIAGRVFGSLARLFTGFQSDVDTLDISQFVRNFGRGVDIIRASFAGSFAFIETLVQNSLATMSGWITDFFNDFGGQVNNFFTGLNVIGRRLSGQEIDASVLSNVIPEFEPAFTAAGQTSGEAFQSAFERAIAEGNGQRFSENLLAGAEARAAERARKAAERLAATRTEDPTTTTTGGGGAAADATARAKALAEVVRGLQNEAEALNFVGVERDIFLGKLATEDALRSALSDSTLGLTEAQIDSLSKLTEAESAQIEALIRGNITKEQTQKFDRERNALVAQTIRSLEQEAEALGLTGRQREVFSRILEIEEQNRANLRQSSLNLTEEQINALARLTDEERESLSIRILGNAALADQAAIYDELRGPQEKLNERIAALNALNERGAISTREYSNALREAQIEQVNLRIQAGDGTFADGFIVSLDRMTNRVRSFAAEAGQIFGNMFDSVSSGFADSIGEGIWNVDQLGESLKRVARDAISQLVSSLVKLGIQFVANQVLASTLGATATGATVAQAAAASAAWAPAAAAASLATLGANAAPAAAGIATTFALTKSLAALGAGFADGTSWVHGPGNSRNDRVLAALSTGEAVINARGNARNPGVAAAMNRGEQVGGSSGNTVVQNFNFPPGTDVDSFRRSQRQIERRQRAAMENNS